MHDRGAYLFDRVLDWVCDLPRAGRRTIFRLHRLAGRDLFSDLDFARVAGVRDFAAGDSDPGSGLSETMGSSSPARKMDDAHLAVCVGNRRPSLSDPLSLVPAGEVIRGAMHVAQTILSALP